MERLFFVPYYTRWHYTRGARELVRNWIDLLWFLTEFLSMGVLLKTLFSPWERMAERYRGGFNLEDMASTFIVNTLMRLVGFVVRLSVLVLGFLSLLVTLVLGIFVFLAWVLFPVLIFFLLSVSVKYFFS